MKEGEKALRERLCFNGGRRVRGVPGRASCRELDVRDEEVVEWDGGIFFPFTLIAFLTVILPHWRRRVVGLGCFEDSKAGNFGDGKDLGADATDNGRCPNFHKRRTIAVCERAGV